MMFLVGQKVVCIEPGLQGDDARDVAPHKGDVGTIVRIYIADSDAMIELAEFPAHATKDYYAGWFAVYFRPVATTDISIFTALLKPTKVDA